jgi:hypothetical protein
MTPSLRMLILLVFTLTVRVSLSQGQPQAARAKEKDPTASRIAILISQLGSSQFNEREAAAKELRKIGFPALETLREAAARSKVAEVRRRARELVGVIENTLDALLADYRGFGLPLLSKGARLGKSAPDKESGRYSLVFFFPSDSKEPLEYLPGTIDLVAPEWDPPATTLDAVHATAKEADAWVQGTELNWPEDAFELAIQCKALGWDHVADAAYRKWREMLQKSEDQPKETPRSFLAKLAWSYWQFHLAEPTSKWPAIARRLQQLLKARPELDTAERRWLMPALEAALTPSKARPGSIEAMIDDLIPMSAEQNGCYYHHGYESALGFHERRNRFLDLRPPPVEEECYLRLIDQGFAAVPALIEHADDIRLTRSFRRGFNNLPDYQCRIQDIVGDLLQGLAGDELGTDDLRRIKAYPVDKVVARAWWERAKKVGEEAHLVAHVLPSEKELHWPSRPMLRILARKYPKHLPRLYQRVLEKRPDLETETLASFLASSSLSRDEKRAIFLLAARSKDLKRRAIALSHLQPLAPVRFVEILVATLDEMPKTPKQPYWLCSEKSFVRLVQKSGAPQAWKALERALHRADVGLRLELLDPLSLEPNADARKQQITLLAGFLDDRTVRDKKSNPQLFDGPFAGFRLPRLEVRNFAGMQLAMLLSVEADPKPTWTPAQWDKLREQVRQALRREKIATP